MTPSDTVHLLRRRWKPAKERLQAIQDGHPTTIRFHRACSWLQRTESMSPEGDTELMLTCQWTAFNALYGQWDDHRQEPRPDRDSWKAFIDRLVRLDHGGTIAATLTEHKPLVMAILDDAYLADYFWKDPSAERARQTTTDKRKASMWFVERRWEMILERVIHRVYFLRCQLLHGAATYGSKLNRTALRRCCTMLAHLIISMMTVFIDQGENEDWGTLCYPPQG